MNLAFLREFESRQTPESFYNDAPLIGRGIAERNGAESDTCCMDAIVVRAIDGIIARGTPRHFAKSLLAVVRVILE